MREGGKGREGERERVKRRDDDYLATERTYDEYDEENETHEPDE